MAQQGTRSWRTTCGATCRYYVQTTIGASWVTAGSANTDAQLAALIGRVQARCPERALRIVEFGTKGQRTERAVEQTALAA